MKCNNATKFYRKSGGAKGRDLLLLPHPTLSISPAFSVTAL
jgi:hypothetical protein